MDTRHCLPSQQLTRKGGHHSALKSRWYDPAASRARARDDPRSRTAPKRSPDTLSVYQDRCDLLGVTTQPSLHSLQHARTHSTCIIQIHFIYYTKGNRPLAAAAIAHRCHTHHYHCHAICISIAVTQGVVRICRVPLCCHAPNVFLIFGMCCRAQSVHIYHCSAAKVSVIHIM